MDNSEGIRKIFAKYLVHLLIVFLSNKVHYTSTINPKNSIMVKFESPMVILKFSFQFIIFKHELRSVDSGVLVEFVLKKVTSLDPNISEVVAEIVQRQILESVEWQTKRKQSCGPRPTPDA